MSYAMDPIVRLDGKNQKKKQDAHKTKKKIQEFYTDLWINTPQEYILNSEEVGKRLYEQYNPQRYNIQYSGSSSSFISANI